MRREDMLREILETVFTRLSVEYINDGETIVIRAKNGYFNTSKYSYSSPSFLKTICALFWYGFHINDSTIKSSIECSIIKKRATRFRGTEYISSDDIIFNCAEYLHNKGLNIYQIREFCSRKEFADFLLSLMVRRFLPAVFNHKFDQTPNKNDNIDEFIDEAFKLMRCDIVDYKFRYIMKSDETEPELVDTRFPKGLCNYKIRFKINNLPFVPSWENVFICIPRNLHRHKEIITTPKTEFEQLIKDFIPYSSEDSIPIFSYDKIEFDVDPSPIQFLISEIMVNVDDFHIRSFYYITRLDEKTCREYYPHVNSNEALRSAVLKQAINDLNEEYLQKVESYYTNIFHTINNVIGSLMNIILSELVNMHPINQEICETTMRAFHLPFEDIIAVIKVYETESSAILLRFYHSIQIAISKFFTNMEISGLHLALYASKFLEEKELKKHIQLIHDFVNSDNLDNVVSIQESIHVGSDTNNSAKPEEKAISNYDITEENHLNNQLFVKVKEILQRYLTQLQEPDPALDPFKNVQLNTNDINWDSIPNPFSNI